MQYNERQDAIRFLSHKGDIDLGEGFRQFREVSEAQRAAQDVKNEIRSRRGNVTYTGK